MTAQLWSFVHSQCVVPSTSKSAAAKVQACHQLCGTFLQVKAKILQINNYLKKLEEQKNGEYYEKVVMALQHRYCQPISETLMRLLPHHSECLRSRSCTHAWCHQRLLLQGVYVLDQGAKHPAIM